MEILCTYKLYAFTHVVFSLVFQGGNLVGTHVYVSRHGLRHLRFVMQSRFQENSTLENSTHENSTHENSTQRKFHPRKIPPNNRLKGGVYLT